LDQNNNKTEIITSNKFYEKFNEILISKNNEILPFTDFRSCFIDLLNGFSNCIRDLDTIFQEENYNENKEYEEDVELNEIEVSAGSANVTVEKIIG
jgi:hypothetical protein